MGFFSKVFRTVSKIAKRIGPTALGALVPGFGPVAAAVAGVAGSRFIPTASAMTGRPTQPPISIGTVQMGIAGIAPGIGRAVAPIAAQAGRIIVGLIRTATGRVRGVRLPSGQFVTRRKMLKLARDVGIAAAAAALGITVAEMAEAVATAPVRRRRGISAADVRRTRSTLRKICVLTRDLKEVTGRKRPCG